MDYATAFNLVTNTAQMNNAWSAEQAQKQMDFQREMSNTAHQREVADLRAAGLNPVLSAKLGGASTPTGAAASADTSLTSAVLSLAQQAMEASTMSAKALSGGFTGSGTSKPKEDWTDLPTLFGEEIPIESREKKESETVNEWLNRQAALLNSTQKPQLFGNTAAMLQKYKKDFPTRRRPIVDAVSNGLYVLQKIVDNKKFTAKDIRNGLGSRYIYNYYRSKENSAKNIKVDAVSR